MYGKDGPFNDPVVRCDSCTKLIKTANVRKFGMCPHCSNTRVRNVRTFSEGELIQLKEWDIDPEWIALFEGVES